jgi:site-specific DNA-methyltransferase (adenine-specific)
MTPYYADDAVTIYHGDCRDVLPDIGSIDLVLTDPPFYLPANITASRRDWQRSNADFGIMSNYFAGTFAVLAKQLRQTGAFYTFCDSTSYAVFLHACYSLFDRTHCLVWDKGSGGLGNGWRHSHEMILHGARTETEYADGFRTDVLHVSRVHSGQLLHPSEKPVELMRELMLAHPDGLILDPFMGSGTTLRAAKDLGRKAIGIEIEERYCEIAAKRMSQSVMNLEAVNG